jgi:hypothetical protein
MKTVQNTYPVFEANQVLSNLHLNQVFDYLGEQERLTRANLIGTGIACGLGLRLDSATTTLHLAPGCGITTEGYLAVEADPVALTSYREYNLPLDVDYPLLRDKAKPGHPAYPVWELFPAGEPDVLSLSSPATFLDNKAVLLFVELKKEGLRNCSPNDCNDRGSQTVVTVRRLLIAAEDLARVLAEAAAQSGALTLSDLEAAILGRLNLPDLRLPRFDVPNTAPTSTAQVLAAFQAVFRNAKLATRTGEALSAAWQAFKPLLQDDYPTDPFGAFAARFGFLDNGGGDGAQLAFLQYYYDLFDDLLRAYDEMRWSGVELVCACVPSELLFPRHLMLGVPRPSGIATQLYRNGFAPACAGEQQREEFVQLFRRLVAMQDSFTHQPPLPKPDQATKLDVQIRVTPSAFGAAALEDKALPYYYRVDGTPPLYQSWSPRASRRRRTNQVLGYRSSEYVPPAPAFVTDALRFDLEPYGFLRIEGHLGKPYQQALATLLTLKRQYRLPIEVIALRTGPFDEKAPLDDSGKARFPDLELQFDVLREELLTTLAEGIRFLYDVPANTDLPAGTPKHPLLKQRAPQFLYDANSVGAWYEKYLAGFLARTYIDVDQNKIDSNAILTVYCALFTGTTGLPGEFFAHVVSIYYMSKLAETLPASLDALAWADFENKCQDLLALTHHFRDEKGATVTADLKQFVPQEELIDHFDQVLYGCNLDAMRAVHDEFVRRLRELKQQQVLGYFLQQHPGIQHKAGVPLGGTFVLVYHEEAASLRTGTLTSTVLSRAVRRIGSEAVLAQDPDILALLDSLSSAAGAGLALPGRVAATSTNAIDTAVKGLAQGTVIADFFLPYRLGGDGPAIQYQLPLPPLGLRVTLGCTDAAGNAMATLEQQGGLEPISYQLDGQPYQALTPTVALAVGDHTLRIRDSAGAESALQAVSVPSNLRLGEPQYIDDQAALSYRVRVPIAGGVMPYSTDAGSIDVNVYTSAATPGGQAVKVAVRDSAGCAASQEFNHQVTPPCDLPCKGVARRGGYRFWLPEGDTARPFGAWNVEVPAFSFEFRDGKQIDLREDVRALLAATKVDDLNANYDKVVRGWIDRINELVAKAVGTRDWLILEYETKTAGMPVLWIERFECLGFDIRILSAFRRPGSVGGTEAAYSPDGTSLRSGDATVKIPPFNLSLIGKCEPNRPVTQVCKPLDLNLQIGASFSNNAIVLDVKATGADQPVLYTWEVQDCTPAIATGARASVTLVSRQPVVKAIRLCAFTAQGCMKVAFSQFNVG